MRIAYLHNNPVPGSAANTVQVMRMCSAMVAMGHTLLLVVPESGDGENPSGDETAALYGCANSFPIHRFRPGWSGMPGFAWRAARRARAERSDLVYGRCIRSCAVAAMFGLRIVFEAHGPPEGFSRSGRRALGYLMRSPRLVRFVVINQALAEHYAERFPALAGRILVAPSATDPVDPAGFEARPSAAGGALRIGYVGSLHPGKGMELIEQIAPAIPEHVVVVVGGEGELLARWRSALAGTPNVDFVGQVPNRDVSPLIAGLDIALAPYQRTVSGANTIYDLAPWMSPLKLFEYMAHGKPVVTSDIPAIREAVSPDVEAVLCDPDQPTEWVAAIQRLAGDPALRQRLGTAARTLILARHTWAGRSAAVLAGLDETM